jgi:hypothetical protein
MPEALMIAALAGISQTLVSLEIISSLAHEQTP